MAAAHVFDIVPDVWIMEGGHCGFYHGLLGLVFLRLRGLCSASILLGLGENTVFVKGFQQSLCYLTSWCTNALCKLGAFCLAHLAVQADDTVGQRGQRVCILCAKGYVHHQLFHAHARLSLQRARIRLSGFCDADCIHDHKVVFVFRGRWRYLLQVIFAQHPRTAPLHLLKVILAAYIPHKDQALNGLHIGTRGDHIHGNGNAWVIIVPKRTEKLLRLFRRIGDFLAERIALPKLFPDDLNNVICVTICFGKNQGLRNLFPPRE